MQRVFDSFGVDAEFLFQSFTAGTNDYIYIWNIPEDTVIVSHNMAEDFDLPDFCLRNYMDTWLERINERDAVRVRKAYYELMEGQGNQLNVEYQVRTAAGQYVWVSSKGMLKRDPKTGGALLLSGMLHNLEYDGKLDSVTGLHGPDKCREFFEAVSASRPNISGSVLMIGIDEFGNINTLKNHSFGDMVLRNLAQAIQTILPERAAAYRFDGDQIAIVGFDMNGSEMMDIYLQLQKFAVAKHEIDGNTLRFTISGGLIAFPENGCSWSDLEIGASIALRQAKSNGKNQCVYFQTEMLIEKLHEQSISHFMLDSVNRDFEGFRSVFQPVCHASTLDVVGAEILLRFETPEGRIINPMEFIPILEHTMLIIPVGMWVLEQAIITCKEWIRYIPDFVMDVNVSYLQLRDPHFCEKVERLLKKYDLDSRHVTLELTESYFITDAPNIELTLQGLRNLHLALAMDDFGTGYSSLARLAQFNIDVVKIDQVFVKSLHKSKYNQDFVESVVRLCHNAGLKVCVEGVESEEEQRSVSLFDVDFVQGFYVSVPISKAKFFQNFVETPFDGKKLVVVPNDIIRQKKLVGDRDLLLALMDATPLCLNIWNRECEIMACNEEVLRLFCVDSSEWFRENFFDFSPEYQPDGKHSRDKVQQWVHMAFETGRAAFQWMHQASGGEPIPVDVTLVRIAYQSDFIVVSYTRDLRPQMAMQRAERIAADRIKAVMDATPLTCILWDMNGRALDCNRVAIEMYAAKNKRDLLEHFEDFSPEYQPDGANSRIKRKEKFLEAKKNGYCTYEWMYQNRGGEEVPCEVSIRNISAAGEALLVAYGRDLRELHRTLEMNHRLAKIAYHDVLTGCASRAAFMESMAEQFASLRNNALFALLIFDLDYFKNVNDTYGHDAGDNTLKAVVAQVTELLPEDSQIGRYGGDEFLIYVKEINPEMLRMLVNRMVSAVAALKLYHEERMFSITISMGAAFWSPGDNDYKELLRRADRALYEAKRGGRDRGVVLEAAARER